MKKEGFKAFKDRINEVMIYLNHTTSSKEGYLAYKLPILCCYWWQVKHKTSKDTVHP